jgi:hypothetical protein
MPFVDMLRSFPSTKECIFRDFPDVLSGEYAAESKECARYLEQFKNNRFLVGYFLRNEPAWAFVDNLVIAEELLNNPKSFVSKDRMIEFLRNKYKTPEALSKSWNRTFVSFDDLRKPIAGAAEFSKTANDDLHEFSRILYDAYISVPSKACREVDPNHMNLGMRWAWVSGPDVVSGWRNFDVFTINHYFPDPTDAINNIVSLGVDLPVLITEFHFGALDTGLISTGLWGVADQRERGKAYRYYCEHTAAHPHGVGCYWFMLYDQFPLGGFDGENYNIGLFDVCSLPCRELTEAVRETSETIYLVANGEKQPTGEMAKSIPAVK